MNISSKVKLTKFAVSNNPLVPTPPMEGYVCGADNGDVSLPIDYWVEGYLMDDIKVGDSIKLNRTCRNGINIPGMMLTSIVTKIEGDIIETNNSKYKLETL